MERDLYKSLINWKKSKHRKPLVLNGARQVGKTWLLTEFAQREYDKVAMFCFDRNVRARKVCVYRNKLYYSVVYQNVIIIYVWYK